MSILTFHIEKHNQNLQFWCAADPEYSPGFGVTLSRCREDAGRSLLVFSKSVGEANLFGSYVPPVA